MSYHRVGELEDYDSNFGDTQDSNNRLAIHIKGFS